MISSRANKIEPFIVMDVMARAEELERAGEDVIHMEVGEPDFETPEAVREAVIKALKSGRTHYTHAMGMLELREVICEHYFNEYGVSVSPDRIMVSCGTSPAMLFIMLALLDPGDSVIVSNPGYSCYPNFVFSADGEPLFVKTCAEDGFQYRPEEIRKKINKKTRAIIINSPCNPTGIVMTEKNLKDITQFEEQYIISDEIYHGLVYEGRARSILEYTKKAFVINGFSKLYAMTGWRLGYIIFPEEYKDAMQKIHQNFMISANSFVQYAGIAALRHTSEDIEHMKKTYNKRRKYIIERLTEIGFKIHVEPTGAFYVFADGRKFFSDSYREAFKLIEEIKVGVTPGIDFGSHGEGYLRFSYATSLENIKAGMDRIEKYYKNVS